MVLLLLAVPVLALLVTAMSPSVPRYYSSPSEPAPVRSARPDPFPGCDVYEVVNGCGEVCSLVAIPRASREVTEEEAKEPADG